MHDHAPHDLSHDAPSSGAPHPLIARLEAEFGYPRLASAHDVAEFLARPGKHCLFIPGDPSRARHPPRPPTTPSRRPCANATAR